MTMLTARPVPRPQSAMTMKAIVCTAYGPPDVLQLQHVERPVPDPDEVLVQVRAATATTTALGLRTGRPVLGRLFTGLTKPKRDVLGVEFAGEVAATGRDVTAYRVGDPVFGMTGATTPGAYAEFKAMPEGGAMLPLPAGTDFSDAAALVEGGLTAIHFLRNKAAVRPGQTVLIYGASGSVGTASVQLAKHLGADVTAVCSAAGASLARSNGADRTVDYEVEDFTADGARYDVVFDTVGKTSFWACRASLVPGGVYLNCASAATVIPMLWTALVGGKKAVLAATYLRPAAETREDLSFLRELIETGDVRAVIDRSYPLEQAAEAHRYVETGRKKGNVVLTL